MVKSFLNPILYHFINPFHCCCMDIELFYFIHFDLPYTHVFYFGVEGPAKRRYYS